MGDFRDPVVAESWHATQLSYPARGEQLDLLLSALQRLPCRRVLDAGVGSGLVAERVLDALPEATLIGVDHSTAMLDRARGRLERFGTRVQLIEGDLAEPDEIPYPPGVGLDLAITVQTLHNMRPEGQQRALASIGRALTPDGILLSLDKLAIPEQLYSLFPLVTDVPPDHAAYAAAEAANAEWAPALETLLTWLRNVGFEPAVLHLRANYALVAARSGSS